MILKNILNLSQEKIGIWGFGITGQSIFRFLKTILPADHPLGILEKKPLSAEQKALIAEHPVTLYPESELDTFLNTHTLIIPSPGIDLRPYIDHRHRWLSELDLFAHFWKKPIIAITGSVGKTTTTHLLSEILKSQGMAVATGGNIGIGCLDLVAQQEKSDCALIEVSSFQLEYTQTFAPSLALWTNLYPNHLDRHGTFAEYAQAKAQIFAHQSSDQTALIPWSLRDTIPLRQDRPYIFLAKTLPPAHELAQLSPAHTIFTVHNQMIVKYNNGITTPLLSLETIPAISYIENVVALVAILATLQKPYAPIGAVLAKQEIPEHRLEKVAVINTITFYNDSKATIAPSTLAALEKLQGNSLILFLGGVSKGVDRQSFIQALPGKVKRIICFGKEAEQLKAWCDTCSLEAKSFATLEEAFKNAVAMAQTGDCILFSPAGASFDLFADYKERGERFKQLVNHYQESFNN